MSFLNNLFQDPKYQMNDPRKPEEIEDPEIIISPDTRREKRIPPGQSRTKKWPDSCHTVACARDTEGCSICTSALDERPITIGTSCSGMHCPSCGPWITTKKPPRPSPSRRSAMLRRCVV